MTNLTRQRILSISIVLLITIVAKGQQISLYDHYFYNPTIYNPAFTGNKETTNVTLISRAQWTGFKGAPKLNVLSIDGRLLNKKMGLGVLIFSDKKGINKTLGGNLLFSYRLNFSRGGHLNFGASARILSHRIDFSQATVENIADPALFTTKQDQTDFDGNLGLALSWRKLELGIAANQILRNKSTYFSEAGNDISYKPSHHYFNSLKYTININKEKQLLLAPQVLVRYAPNTPTMYEINTNLYLKKRFWVGGAYKNEYAVSINAGISLLDKFDIGYSYDIITSNIGQYAGISHELMINFKFAKKWEKQKIVEEDLAPVEVLNYSEQKEIPKEIESEIKEEPQDSSKPKEEIETDVVILRASAKNFVNDYDKQPEQGVYVIVGSFFYQDFAIAYCEKTKQKGCPQANWFYSENRKHNYIYMFKETNLEDGLAKVNTAREIGTQDAWIIILKD